MSLQRRLSGLTRRQFVKAAGASAAAFMSSGAARAASEPDRHFEHGKPLREFSYGDVDFQPGLHQSQLEQTHAILMGLDEDGLLRPFRMAAGLPAPGRDLGGWHSSIESFGPESFGHWMSALSRYYATTGDRATRARVERWLELFSATIDSKGSLFRQFSKTSCCIYNKLFCGLEDAWHFAGLAPALDVLERMTTAAVPYMPGRALGQNEPNNGCESYIIPEYQFLAWQWGADARHLEMARHYLYDAFFDPLARGENVLPGCHAYSHVNALCSSAKAYLVLGEEKYLKAAMNGFAFVEQQSFVTGGWGAGGEVFLPLPEIRSADGSVRSPALNTLGDALEHGHAHFETPCGSQAHFKLTRYLLRITKDAHYGDSMERVMYNTVLGALPLNKFGKAFYQSDYHSHARKQYFDGYGNIMEDEWPCCSGTLPQVAADYRISTYFRDEEGVYVNLYIPSTLRWEQRGARVSLAQSGAYPLDDRIELEIAAARPISFSLRFRIPAWAQEATILLNGQKVSEPVRSGTFASLRRTWKSGDRIELRLPRRLQLQAVDEKHPDCMALVCGPLVLFAVSEDTPKVTKEQLLEARQQGAGSAEWRAETTDGPLRLTPFWAIKDETYFTYLSV